MVIEFICGFVSCIGFAYLFNCPQKHILRAAFAGGCGWLAYDLCMDLGATALVATLVGTIALSICCECFARTHKDALTVFTIPAILPLVPGAGVYNTLLSIIEGDFIEAILKGLDTLGCAMSIAIGIMMVSSIFKIATMLKKDCQA